MKAAQAYDYDTFRLPLIGSQLNREASSAKDQIFYNVMVDAIPVPLTDNKLVGEKMFLVKRGGFTASTTVVGGGGTGRGVYYWGLTGNTYSVIGNTLYSGSTALQTINSSTGTIVWTEDTGTNQVLLVGDGTQLWSIATNNTVTQITSANLPPTFAYPVSMDAYIFLLQPATDVIWNSDVDALTFTATSFLSKEMYPDNVVALARQLNYIVAFGTYSMEFFYDNANASGSPLTRNESIAIKVGCAAPYAVAQADNRMVWVAQSNNGNQSVWMCAGLSSAKVSTAFVDRIIFNEGSTLANATATICKHKGHTLYLLNLSTNNRTLVYDLDTNLWFDWSHNNSGVHNMLPYTYMTQGANGQILALHNTNGIIYQLAQNVYQDDLAPIYVEIVTRRLDFDETRQKRFLRVELIGDQQSTGTVTLDWSDDDYTTFGVVQPARTLDLTGTVTVRPMCKSIGRHRRPAFRLQHTSNGDFRAEALEFDYSMGSH